jgi:hypothetical protein
MTAISTETSRRSRRVLLAGALGGLATWAASTASRVDPAAAAAGDPMRIGRTNRHAARKPSLKPTALARRSSSARHRAPRQFGAMPGRGGR